VAHISRSCFRARVGFHCPTLANLKFCCVFLRPRSLIVFSPHPLGATDYILRAMSSPGFVLVTPRRPPCHLRIMRRSPVPCGTEPTTLLQAAVRTTDQRATPSRTLASRSPPLRVTSVATLWGQEFLHILKVAGETNIEHHLGPTYLGTDPLSSPSHALHTFRISEEAAQNLGV